MAEKKSREQRLQKKKKRDKQEQKPSFPEHTKKSRLEKILNSLGKAGDILGSAVISADGLPIASVIQGDADIGTFAAMSAAAIGAAETAAVELDLGILKQLILDAEKGKVITISAGKDALLVVLTRSEINLGLVLLEMGRASTKIDRVIRD